MSAQDPTAWAAIKRADRKPFEAPKHVQSVRTPEVEKALNKKAVSFRPENCNPILRAKQYVRLLSQQEVATPTESNPAKGRVRVSTGKSEGDK